MIKRGRFIWLAGAALLVVLVFAVFKSKPSSRNLIIGSQKFRLVGLATSPEAREIGLSGRAKLNDNQAMLFVFERPDAGCFWMKDMKFDIDILWFDQNKKLVHEKRNATPASYPESFCPPGSAKYVVEVSAGTAERLNLKLGDALVIPNNPKQ